MSGDGLPRIGYLNFFDFGTRSYWPTGPISGYDYASAFDRLRFTRFRATAAFGWAPSPAMRAVALIVDCGTALQPDYLALADTEGFFDSPVNSVSVWGSADGVTYDIQVHPSEAPVRRGLTWLQINPGVARRYWAVVWDTQPSAQVCGASVVMLGKALVLTEGMAAGFDDLSFEPEIRESRSRGGVHVGSTVENVKSEIALKFGAAGIDLGEFAPATGSGITQTPSIDRFLRSYYALGRPFAFYYPGPMTRTAWCVGSGGVKRPYIAPLRRGLQVKFSVTPDGIPEADE